MANDRLYALFDEQNKVAKDLVTSSPKTLDDMVSTGAADIDGLNAQLDMVHRVLPAVDYSDFSNFVSFNSALDYFNLSGDRLMREWPYGGTYSDQLKFLSASDPYQTHLANVWPRWHGYADFSGSGAYVRASDMGLVDGNSVSGLLNATSSFTIEGHISIDELPTPGDGQAIMQRFSGSDLTWQLYLTSNAINIQLSGATLLDDWSTTITTGSFWFAVVVERVNPSYVYVKFYRTNPTQDAVNTFQDGPFLATTSGGSMDLPLLSHGQIIVGSSDLSLPNTIAVDPKYRLSELRFWNVAKTDHELFANYNLRVFSDPTLMLYWRFAEGYTRNNSVVRDYSGRAMHGKISGNASAMWASSSLDSDQTNYFGMSPQDLGEYVIPYNPQDDDILWNFITTTQNTAELYDRNNSNIITNLVPFQFLYLEEERNTEVLKNLLYLLGRQFDELKVKIDQFSKLLTVNYTEFDQTPSALLADALKFWGWDSKGNFLNKEAFQHFFGYDTLTSAPSPTASLSSTYLPPAALNNQATYDNQRLDTVLADIKTEFWKRTLNNLIYLYKTKGTKESVESLLRIYGLDDRLVKVKEFGLKKNASIETHRIASEKSFWAYRMSGSAVVTTVATDLPLTPVMTTELQIRFPTDYNIVPSGTNQWHYESGSIFFNRYLDFSSGAFALPFTSGVGMGGPSGSVAYEEMQYHRTIGSTTGTLLYAFYSGTDQATQTLYVSASGVNIFDGRWYHVMVHRTGDGTGVTASLHVQHLDEDRIDYDLEVSASVPSPLFVGFYDFSLGRSLTGSSSGSEYWCHNVNVWSLDVNETEDADHTLNPFSIGTVTPDRALSHSLSWQFDYDVDQGQARVWDSSITNPQHGLRSPKCAYERFSRPYNYIAPPDYGWNEEKIRTFEGSTVPYGQQWLDSNAVSVEFNLIDALNEDISYILASMDNWNNIIGDHAARHRASYPELDRFRQQYFTRLVGRINFRAFADFMDFFDRSFVEMIKKLLPARVNFKGAEFVVESHMLERPKVQYTYRRQSPALVPEGVIWVSGPDRNPIQWVEIE